MFNVAQVGIDYETGLEIKTFVSSGDIKTITNHCLSDYPYIKDTKIESFNKGNGVILNIIPTGFKNLVMTSSPTSFKESLGYPANDIGDIGELDFVYMDCSKLISGSLFQIESSPINEMMPMIWWFGDSVTNYGLFENCVNLDFDCSKSLPFGEFSFKNTIVSLQSLINGDNMFKNTSLSKFDYDLPKLKSMRNMFAGTPLKEFKINLYSLTQSTFSSYQIKEFIIMAFMMMSYGFFESIITFFYEMGLIEENDGRMFIDGVEVTEDMQEDYLILIIVSTTIKFFPEFIIYIRNIDEYTYFQILSYAVDISFYNSPFYISNLETFAGDMPVMEYGCGMFNGTNLKNYVGDLSSLKNGFGMFGRKPFNDYGSDDIYEEDMSQPSLNSVSVFNILHSIPNREENAPQPTDILEMLLLDGVISIAIDSTEENSNEFAKEIGYETFEELNQHFLEKGWYVDWIFNPATTSYNLRRVEKTIPRDYYDIKEINTSVLPENFRKILKKDISIKDIYKNNVYKSKTDGKHYIILTSKFKTQWTDESLENIKDVIKKYNLEKI